MDIHIMTEESEIFRITNSHTYHSALKSEKKSNSEKSYCLSRRFEIKIQCFKKMIFQFFEVHIAQPKFLSKFLAFLEHYVLY